MPPTAPVPGDSTTSTETPIETSSDRPASGTRQQPIPPASEPMQYRAIGLVKGTYQPSPEQFTRGMMVTEDGTAIGAVLLGRVMSLVKKHLDLAQNHLWVVYPRTRDKNEDLHLQIVGVWEPEKLSLDKAQSTSDEAVRDEAAGDETASDASTAVAPQIDLEAPEAQDGYFSIRGEVLYYSADEQRLIVKIQQSPRSDDDPGKAFKLNLKGSLPGNKTVGYFWDLQVQREHNLLAVQEGSLIALVPPKKRKPGEISPDRRRSSSVGAPRRTQGQRPPLRMSDRPNITPPAPRREPIAKPVKRPKDGSA
jgi:hypothetical protein